MATAGNGEVMGKEDAKEGTGKILWLFPRLRFSNQEPKKPNVEVREEVKLPKNPPPRSVFFGIRQTSLPPLEAEALESVGRTSNPAILWQVYVLSGFLVLNWVWTRWKERKKGGDEKGSSDDDHSPADDDEYSHFSD
ncbi:hypothetical protein SLEP1_g42645 [Rubroshorea leprosula]|uniref:Uncharacterized protein n=1 Tax=Rubroshorea leprosula TaxID=152421 RepID=A0AAV5LBI5_9ROSI|nr:hypothetical protein SLEP1_g42645 [Rubroshorea leprosula]